MSVRTAPGAAGVASESSVDQLRCRDEILQLLFWMSSQGLGDRVSRVEITRFIPLSEDDLGRHLGELVSNGLVAASGDDGPRWQLTPRGEAEARHRFADVIEDLVGVLGHGASCGPDCSDDHEPR